MIDFFIKDKTTRITKLAFCTLQKPDNIKVVGYFQKNDHFFAENFEESGFVFCSFEAAK
jgi:isochorismate synthase